MSHRASLIGKLVSGMEQRRFLLFFVISMAIWMAWINFAVPALFPEFAKPAAKPVKSLDDKIDSSGTPENAVADGLKPANIALEPEAKVAAAIEPQLPQHPVVSLYVGPPDPDNNPDSKLNEKLDEFFLAANLDSRGASVEYVELTDKDRFPAFGRRGDRVRIIGSDDAQLRSSRKTYLKTFGLRSPQVDQVLTTSSLDEVPWEIVPEADPKDADRAVTFRFKSPDGHWELRKRFELKQLTHEELKQPDIRRTLLAGYELKLTITVKNLTEQERPFNYTLQGPVGVPLEDAENSYKYRDVRMGFLRDDGITLDENKLSAAETVKKAKAEKTEVWKRKIKYIGIDVLYFAALVIPSPNQVDSAKAIVTNEFPAKTEFSDISVALSSATLAVPGNDEVSHVYRMFAGPKKKELIAQIPALAVMDYGWFDAICQGMVWLLNMFHSMGLSYGLAIICLTALVRTLLLPISKHQAANASKMKELQPKMLAKQKELEEKYGKGTDEYMKAAQELSKEQLGLMFSGCLPVLLQLPIFIALYRAIGSSIELRMEPFLWFENLASPDALFKLPFVVPWLGWTHFNLLPCISTGLMFVHQKFTMPEPTNEEQAQQQKMMSYMMIFMGAMFFRVPSGLCLYFIATNVWSMTERWVFERLKRKSSNSESNDVTVSTGSTSTAYSGKPASGKPASGKPDKEPSKPTALGGIWDRLQQSADNQHSATRKLGNSSTREEKEKKKKK